MPKRIFAVGFDLPGDEFEHVPFDSDQSLLDADIVLFEPSFGQPTAHEQYQGKPLFSESKSPQVREKLRHWKSELVTAADAGKLVIVFLAKPLVYFAYTGRQTFSGTGRSRVTENLVNEVSSYEAVPNVSSVEPKSGREIRLTAEAGIIAPYWKEFADLSPYEAFIDGKFTQPLLTTKAGGRIVGALVRGKGSLLLLPPLRYDVKSFVNYSKAGRAQAWTPEALQFGKRLLGTLVSLADSLAAGRARTPPPQWAQHPKFATQEESALHSAISSVTEQVSALQERRAELQRQLEDAGALRGLLYEQGEPLEKAVREALELFGFTAKPFKEGESEFDVVFESAEGRFLGEVEGKDARAINIDKLSQLERNLQEDFARERVTAYAKGVLFGNPERLTALESRDQAFTKKCLSGAKRAGTALVRTSDMFEPARYLRGNHDPEYATSCRKVIFETGGDIVQFPPPPASGIARVAEAVEASDDPGSKAGV